MDLPQTRKTYSGKIGRKRESGKNRRNTLKTSRRRLRKHRKTKKIKETRKVKRTGQQLIRNASIDSLNNNWKESRGCRVSTILPEEPSDATSYRRTGE